MILRSGNWISNNFKKQQRANIVFLFKNGLECNFKAKIRFHGDNPDHIIVVNDFNFITSLDVQLIESNIENITKFKLFIPHTRGGDQEILATNFLRELNFFAPKTKYINASINGLKQKYLFQEKISKEFIESNGFTEGPIIEGDQRLLWEGQRSLQLSRIINKNWVKQNWRNAYVALDSLSRVNELYLKFYQSINNFNESKNYFLKDAINIIEKDNYKSDFYLKNLYFDRLIFSLGGQHALVPDNRTFYYNYIENNFYPIFYDANINRNTFKFDKSLKNQKQIKSNIILDQLKKIDLLNNIQQKNKKAGLSHAALISYEGYFSKIEKNYRNELKTLNESKIKNIQEQNFNNFYKRFKNKKIKLIFFNKKPNVFLVCDKDILKCKEKIFSLAEISEIVSQRYKSNSENIYIFVTSDFKKYKNNHLVLYKSNWEKIKIHKSFYAKIKKEEIELKFDNKKKEIFIKQKKPNGRVIFFSKRSY